MTSQELSGELSRTLRCSRELSGALVNSEDLSGILVRACRRAEARDPLSLDASFHWISRFRTYKAAIVSESMPPCGS